MEQIHHGTVTEQPQKQTLSTVYEELYNLIDESDNLLSRSMGLRTQLTNFKGFKGNQLPNKEINEIEFDTKAPILNIVEAFMESIEKINTNLWDINRQLDEIEKLV